jgi:hypothetical protein
MSKITALSLIAPLGLMGAWVATASLGGCSDEGVHSPAGETLRNTGLTPVEVGGYGWFDCGQGDVFATRFTATNAEGREVQGTVCKGILKGSTVRFD